MIYLTQIEVKCPHLSYYVIIGTGMVEGLSDVLSLVHQYSVKPPLFEPGETLFWDDPHISKGMLAAHLDPDNDAASRRHATIDEEVQHLVSSGILKPGYRLLDLGCGPGLYSSRLAMKGLKVTGIDISQRSLNYARRHAKKKGLNIEYCLMNFFDIVFNEEFDAVLQTHGELNTFSDEKRDELLSKLHKALKPGGLLIFDVTTRAQRKRAGLKNGWYVSNGGFWRPDRHLVLEQGFDYPKHDTWLDQYIIIYSDNVFIYNNWIHDYTLESIREVLHDAGFDVINAWNDLTGTPYEEGGDCIAIVARRGDD